MGGLRKFVDKIKPTFSEGGKLSFLAFHAIKVKLKGKVAGAQRVEHKTKSLYAFAMKNVFDE